MKQLILVALAVAGLAGCQEPAQDTEAAKEAVKVYMSKTMPGYKPSGFLPVAPFARKDSLTYHYIRTGEGSMESTDKTTIGLYVQHGYSSRASKPGEVDTALFLVMKDGRVIQLNPVLTPSPI